MINRKLKIGIDVRCFVEGRRTGVEEYTFRLLSELFKHDNYNKYILFLSSFHKPKDDLQFFKKFPNVEIRRFRFPNKLLNLFFWYFNWPHADKMLGGTDIFFMPNIGFIGLSKDTKRILTMHDLSFERMPEAFSLKRRLWHIFISPRKLCRRADLIVAVSASTKKDLISQYGIPEEKIKRIYSGVGDEFCQIDRNSKKLVEVKEKFKLPFRFIFCLSTIEPRKNIVSLVRAFDHLKALEYKELKGLKLVIAGNKGWKIEEILNSMRNAKSSDDIIFINGVSNEDRVAIYNLASVFVYPSFFEGFGFPVLEAMKCGVPVIASNTSSLPEVVGSEGIMIDPDKPDEIADAIKAIFLNKNLREELSEKGQRRTIMFNWEKTSKDFLAVLEDMV